MAPADESGMGNSRADRILLVQKIVLAMFVLGALGGLTWTFVQRNTFTVSAAPGTMTSVRIVVPMQHAGGHKSFAKQRDLPVTCTITATGDYGAGPSGGIHLSVVATGHGLHKMWAQVRITIDADAPAGRHKRSCEFTIDGQGDWPIATLLVNVGG